MRFYNHHLRYPAAALQQGLEQTVSFSLRIGEHNQLLEFKPKAVNEAAADVNTGRITVTARAVRVDKTVSPGTAEPDFFMQELKAVSYNISTDTTAIYPPGEYAFTIKFRLEPAQ